MGWREKFEEYRVERRRIDATCYGSRADYWKDMEASWKILDEAKAMKLEEHALIMSKLRAS